MAKKGWYDLSWNFGPGMAVPEWPGQKNQDFTMTSFHMENTGGNQDFICMNLHCGTHVDAPGHYHPGGLSIDKVPYERWMGTCLSVDLGRAPLSAIDVKDLEPYKDQMGKVDMFFVRTGADDMWGTPDYCWKYPFFTPEAGEYMVKNGVKIIGMDTPGPDASLRSGFRKGSPLAFHPARQRRADHREPCQSAPGVRPGDLCLRRADQDRRRVRRARPHPRQGTRRKGVTP